MNTKYQITNIDFDDHDAFITVNEVEFYFQWCGDNKPTIEDAKFYLRHDVEFVKQIAVAR